MGRFAYTRSRVLPIPALLSSLLLPTTASAGPVPLRERRLPWSELLRRVFAIDAFRCDRCGGRRMRILAAIDQPEVIRAILDWLGLDSRAPPLTPAPSREPTDFELGFVDPWPSDEPADDG